MALKISNYKKIIKTRSTIIKPITEEQISERYISWLNDPEINKYLEVGRKKQTKDSVISYINSLRLTNNCEMFAIFDEESNSHIGNLTITSFNKNNNGSIDLGVMIGDKNSRSAGIGAEVLLSFIDFIFSYDIIERISAGAAAENLKSCKTLESIGFCKDGVGRESFLLNNGCKCDYNYYSLVREEWRQKRKRFINVLEVSKVISEELHREA